MVTYIFGAGASLNSIPLAAKLSDDINEFGKTIADYRKSSAIFPDIEINGDSFSQVEILNEIIALIKKIIDESSEYASIDAYAKVLSVREDYSDITDLKNILICYFTWRQLVMGFEKRYGHFASKIIDSIDDQSNSFIIPNTVRFLSWNYDVQFEVSLLRLIKNASKYAIVRDRAGILPCMDYSNIYNHYAFIKLNGTALAYNSKINDFYIFPYPRVESIISNPIYSSILTFCILRNNIEASSKLKFAWENRDITEEIYKSSGIYKALLRTNELISVGYSFPDFNRNIDKLIITNMIELRRIIIQAESLESAQKIKSQVLKILSFHINKVEIVIHVNPNEFYLHPSL